MVTLLKQKRVLIWSRQHVLPSVIVWLVLSLLAVFQGASVELSLWMRVPTREIAHICSLVKFWPRKGNRDLICQATALVTPFSYSDSGAIVLSAKFAPAPGNHQVIKQEMDRLTHLRELKQPQNTIMWVSLSVQWGICNKQFQNLDWKAIVSVVLKCLNTLVSWSMLLTERRKLWGLDTICYWKSQEHSGVTLERKSESWVRKSKI